MQLTYRGIAFTALPAGSPAQETGDTGLFLGQRYPLKQAAVSQRQPSVDLIYRGVRYCR